MVTQDSRFLLILIWFPSFVLVLLGGLALTPELRLSVTFIWSPSFTLVLLGGLPLFGFSLSLDALVV